MIIPDGNAALVMGDNFVVATGPIYRNNITSHGDYGVFGSGKGEGKAALDFFAPNAVFTNNGLIGFTEASYPSGNYYPMTIADVGFSNAGTDDYHLTAASALKGAGSDKKDVGADIDAIDQRHGRRRPLIHGLPVSSAPISALTFQEPSSCRTQTVM